MGGIYAEGRRAGTGSGGAPLSVGFGGQMMRRIDNRMIVGIALFVAMAAVALYLGWEPRAAAPSASQPSPSNRAPVDAPIAKAAGLDRVAAPTAARVSTVIDSRATGGLLLLDRVSRRPIANANITAADGAAIGTTDRRGILAVSSASMDPMTAELLAQLPEAFGGDRLSLDPTRRKDGLLVEATVPAMARVEIHVMPEDLVQCTMITSFVLPDLPSDTGAPETLPSQPSHGQAPFPHLSRNDSAQLLQMERLAVPELFAFRTAAPDLNRKSYTLKPQENTNCFVVDVPFNGDTVVDVLGIPQLRARRIVRAERGRVDSIDVALVRMATITGIVTDGAGSPYPKHTVHALVKSHCYDCRPIYTSRENGETVIVGPDGALSFEIDTRTDEEGHFAFYLPFTDDVILRAVDTSTVRGPAECVVRRKLGSPMESASDVVLALRPPPRRIRVQIAAADGAPRARGEAHIWRGSADGGTQTESQKIPIDATGWCNLTFLSSAEGEFWIHAVFADGTSTIARALRSDDLELVDGGKLRLR